MDAVWVGLSLSVWESDMDSDVFTVEVLANSDVVGESDIDMLTLRSSVGVSVGVGVGGGVRVSVHE